MVVNERQLAVERIYLQIFFKKAKKVLDNRDTPCYNLRVRFETPV